MSDEAPRNGILYRLERLEKEVDRLKDGKPDVIAERVQNIAIDVHELREEVKSIRRLVLGMFTTIATGLAVAIIVQNQGAL